MTKTFEHGTEYYDLSTYFGRLKKFISIINPKNLIYSDKEVRAFEAVLKQSKAEFKGAKVAGKTDEEMWQAATIVESAIHPDTNEIVAKPFRMCGYVPCNVPILVGLLVPQGVVATAFWQWLNQTHNALVNYANRNAKTPVSVTQQVAGYTLAVSSAMGVSFFCNKQLARHGHRLSASTRSTAQKVVPFVAVATASALNTVAMRNAELTAGIEVMTTNGQVLGPSQAAAKEAIGLTVVSRVVIAAGCLLTPPLATTLLERRHIINSTLRPRQYLIAQTFVCALSFFSVLPAAIAIFPQTGKLPVPKLESHFDKKEINGDYVLYNKGL